MKTGFVLLLIGFSTLTFAQSPYAGQEARDIKALSQDEVEGLLAGHGMGFAKAAELNGYPGPRHVLDLADELELTAAQREQTQALFDTMQASATALGQQLVAAERRLDRLFAARTIDDEQLDDALGAAGELRTALRRAHLAAHLRQTEILTPEQVHLYMRLRGYNGHGGHDMHGGAHHHGEN